ncbi:hypothetical protein GCM10011609_84640 [Lentzea pudingi]|uniref:Uncharacterized protein n=1 Tax=Lentzea pudingi TaxID=1789439 RepID=A0ABQ2ISV3_9PSEU|nr:hypothetical protein [Lentzea pudingi]GGN28470.1 hypothetical protein GCM10011609_84640 [Lentzea pudingi]
MPAGRLRATAVAFAEVNPLAELLLDRTELRHTPALLRGVRGVLFETLSGRPDSHAPAHFAGRSPAKRRRPATRRRSTAGAAQLNDESDRRGARHEGERLALLDLHATRPARRTPHARRRTTGPEVSRRDRPIDSGSAGGCAGRNQRLEQRVKILTGQNEQQRQQLERVYDELRRLQTAEPAAAKPAQPAAHG